MGISVAHYPCYTLHDIIPSYVHACPNLDVAIWSGYPPVNMNLLNISGSIVDAKMGDAATAFGYSKKYSRAWHGTIVGQLGYNTSGKDFTPSAYENEKELLFQEAQQQGMSGAVEL